LHGGHEVSTGSGSDRVVVHRANGDRLDCYAVIASGTDLSCYAVSYARSNFPDQEESKSNMHAITQWTNYRRMFSAITISSLSLLTCVALNSSGTSSAQTRKRTVILAVSAESGEASADAIAILEGKRLLSP